MSKRISHQETSFFLVEVRENHEVVMEEGSEVKRGVEVDRTYREVTPKGVPAQEGGGEGRGLPGYFVCRSR